MLSIRLLGTPEIRQNGEIVRFATRTAQALLIYLAVEGGLHSRDKLISLFFPDHDSERSRPAFRTTLMRMRSALGKHADDHIIIDGAMVGLALNQVEVDVHRIKQLAEMLRHSKIEQAAILLKQIDLARGAFLEGFLLNASPEFDNWVTLKQQQVERSLETTLEQLAVQQFTAGQFGRGIETCTRWLTYNPLSESAYRQLMKFYIAAGNTTSAVNTYETCRTMLLSQLSVEPSGETLELYQALQSGGYSAVLPKPFLERLEAAVALVAEDAVFINPTGMFTGKAQIYTHLTSMIQQGVFFDLFHFVHVGGVVCYHYRVMKGDFILDTSDDGLTIVKRGKIVFDGTSRSVTEELLTQSQALRGEDPVKITRQFYGYLNG